MTITLATYPGSRELRDLISTMRNQGATWVQIADELRSRNNSIHAMMALRLAHGWSQQTVVQQHWNRRWPDEQKHFKQLSTWECWVGRQPSFGYPPSLVTLDRLAQLYCCRVADLLADFGDHRHLDPAWPAACAPEEPGEWR